MKRLRRFQAIQIALFLTCAAAFSSLPPAASSRRAATIRLKSSTFHDNDRTMDSFDKALKQLQAQNRIAESQVSSPQDLQLEPNTVDAPLPAPTQQQQQQQQQPSTTPVMPNRSHLRDSLERKAPKFETPDGKLPEKNSFSVPSFEMPKTPDMKLELPKAPIFEMPKVDMPKISLPSFGDDNGGYAKQNIDADDADLEPQEVRDSRAKDARSVFLKYDRIAKDLEKQAREARGNANDKKKIAREFKDEACKTRPGGKFFCLRPLNSGY